jgi:hypothetical protein
MEEVITIEQELHNRSRWIKVFVPSSIRKNSSACIQDKQGVVLKRLSLSEGYNSIDVSQIEENIINIKVETPFETILKEINLKEL